MVTALASVEYICPYTNKLAEICLVYVVTGAKTFISAGLANREALSVPFSHHP